VVTALTVETAVARNVMVNNHPVPLRERVDFCPDLIYLACGFMSEDRRGDSHSMKLLNIRSTDSADSHLDEDLFRANVRDLYVGNLKLSRAIDDGCFQSRLLPARANATLIRLNRHHRRTSRSSADRANLA
jgi:hypothetical protein